MAAVVFLRGVNVGGHRRMRPSVLAKDLAHLGVVNIGAAGTFVVRKAVSRAALRTAIRDRLEFDIDLMICSGSEIISLVADDPFRPHVGRDIVPFVGVMAPRGRPASFALQLPADGEWCLKVLRCQGPFLLGMYRRQMKSINYLGQVEKSLGIPLTIRNWNTIQAIGKALQS